MKSIRKNTPVHTCVSIFALAALFLTMSAGLSAQIGPNSNPPPFDFTDAFYSANGIALNVLNAPASQRFGLFRLTGPPAGPGQVNWVIDNSNADPTRNNVRILATTGGYRDSDGSPTQFISIIAFANGQGFFTGVPDARGILMKNIVNQFEAYAGPKQKRPDGTFVFQPCSSSVTTNCFSTDVSTPNLRQDWRFSTNRNHYFCDDLLGMWIITFFFYTPDAFTNPACQTALANLAATNGLSLDGTPIIKTGDQLNALEAFTPPCAAEFNNPQSGSAGVVWLVCPAIPDPTNGAIAPDAFLDSVHKPDGTPLDPQITRQFQCLQTTGQFCSP